MSEHTVVVRGRGTVVVSAPGPQGPPGPTGPPGPPGGEYMVYDRDGVPAATWSVVHNLGRMVHVSVFGDDKRQVIADVEQPDENTVVVTFGVPFSGFAVIG